MMRTTESRTQTPGVRDLVAILARRKWLILLVALPVIAVSILYSYSRTPAYSASTGILVRPALTSLTLGSRTPDLDAQTESSLATSVAVATLAQGVDGHFRVAATAAQAGVGQHGQRHAVLDDLVHRS